MSGINIGERRQSREFRVAAREARLLQGSPSCRPRASYGPVSTELAVCHLSNKSTASKKKILALLLSRHHEKLFSLRPPYTKARCSRRL